MALAIASATTSPVAEKLRAQATELEGVFLNTLVSEMFSNIKTDGDFGGGFGEQTWRSMQSEQLSGEIARAGGIGLADQMLGDMLKLQGAAPVPPVHCRREPIADGRRRPPDGPRHPARTRAVRPHRGGADGLRRGDECRNDVAADRPLQRGRAGGGRAEGAVVAQAYVTSLPAAVQREAPERLQAEAPAEGLERLRTRP